MGRLMGVSAIDAVDVLTENYAPNALLGFIGEPRTHAERLIVSQAQLCVKRLGKFQDRIRETTSDSLRAGYEAGAAAELEALRAYVYSVLVMRAEQA